MSDQGTTSPKSPSDTLDLESGTEKTRIEDVAVPEGVVSSSSPQEQPYDPAPVTDSARKAIGYALLALLFVIVLGAFWELMRINMQALDAANAANAADGAILAADAKADGERLVSIINIVFGPVVTLLGSVTGFYFGTQSVRNSGGSANK